MVNMLTRQFNGESGQDIFDQLLKRQHQPNNSCAVSGEIQVDTAKRAEETIKAEPSSLEIIVPEPEEELIFMNISSRLLFQPERWASTEHYANILERVYTKEAKEIGLEISKPISFNVPEKLSIELMELMYDHFNMILVGMPTFNQVELHSKNMKVLYPDRDENWTNSNDPYANFGNIFEDAVKLDHLEINTYENFRYKNPSFAGKLFFIEMPESYDPEYDEDDPFFNIFDEYPHANSLHRFKSWDKTLKILEKLNVEINQICIDNDIDIKLKVVLAPVSNFVNKMIFQEADTKGYHRILTGRPFKAEPNSLITVGANVAGALSKFGYASVNGYAINGPWTVRFAVIIDED